MPPQKPADKVQARGAARMRELGMKQVVVWLDTREQQLIADAANGEQLPVATWIRKTSLHAAEDAAKKKRSRARREDAGN